MKVRTLAILLVVVTLTSCATYSASTSSIERSPLEQAKLTYVAGSLDYDFALKVVKELRAASAVNDAQWSRIEQAALIAQEWAPLVESMLEAWEKFGNQPRDFAAAMGKLAMAFSEVVSVKREVQP